MGAADRSYITTPRLRLRPIGDADIPALVPAIGNYDVARWLGRVPYPYREDDAAAFIDGNRDKTGCIWFIHDAEGLVGGISIDGELGYWLKRQAWGRGYATEAAFAAIAAHFADPANDVLHAGHFPDNDRSARVLAKLGFRPAGTKMVAARALSQQVECRAVMLTRARWESLCPDLSRIAFSATAPAEGVMR